MVLITANKPKQIFVTTFAGRVTAAECVEAYKDVPALISDFEPGFRILVDLTSLTSMEEDCASEITKVMDFCAKKGVKMIVRVIPDPSKDIGFVILSRFHYRNNQRTFICHTLLEAAKHLDL